MIGKYASLHGVAATLRDFSKKGLKDSGIGKKTLQVIDHTISKSRDQNHKNLLPRIFQIITISADP